MQSKFPGKCGCGAAFNRGDEIRWEKGVGVIGCPSCGGARRAAPSAAPVVDRQSYVAKRKGSALVTAADVTGPQPLLILPPSTVTLDTFQQAVVDWKAGCALVAAGAGSGKTTTLIERIAALIGQGALPESILLLVYNRKAADDMKKKLSDRLGSGVAERVGAFTFHGWGQRLLRKWGHPSADVVLGADDESPSPYPLAQGVLRDMNVQGEVDGYLAASNFIREALIDLAANDSIDRIAELRVAEGNLKLAKELRDFTVRYQQAKAQKGAIDFADMLAVIGNEIQRGTQRAQALTNLYAHVMVDEAQDANVARNVIAWHLGTGAKTLVVVGDLRQSIYGFTGARPDLFKGLLDKGATLLTMPVNRRSTAAIVAAGNAVAEGRDWNLGGACSPKPDAEAGEPVQFWTCDEGQGAQIAAEIQARVAAGLPLTDGEGRPNYACLVRTNAGGASLEAGLTARGLPVRVLGSHGGVWATTAGRHFYAYLAAAEDRAVNGLAAIANRPLRYIKGEITKPLVVSCKDGGLVGALRATYNRGALRLATDLERLAGMEWAERCEEVADFLITDLKERAAEAGEVAGKAVHPDEDKEKAYEALASAAVAAGSLAAIDAQVAAMKKVKATDPAVEISTCHKAKGAEWTVVFATGMEEGVFPHAMAEDVEEERRLFYVAVTRAKKACIVTCAANPSEFFTDLQSALTPREDGPKGGEEKPAEVAADEEQKDADLAHASCRAMDAAWEGEEKVAVESAWPAGMFNPLKLEQARKHAEAATKAEPKATAGEGGRYVQPVVEDFDTLLAHLGFWEAGRDVEKRVNQKVWETGWKYGDKGGAVLIRVFSTLPVGGQAARERGEDSMKVAAIYQDDAGREFPMHKKLPYAARTRGWRVTLLAKIEEVAKMIHATKACVDCGAPKVERVAKATGKTFTACAAFCRKNGGR